MEEQQKPDEQPTPVDATWESLNLEPCPRCGSFKLLPAVPAWDGDRFCLGCNALIAADGQLDA